MKRWGVTEMTIAASISSWDIGSFRNEVRGFDVKTKNAYLELTLQLRLRGSLPFDGDPAEAGGRYLGVLARIADVTKRFWRDTAWPLLCDLFVVRDGRLSHPEIEREEPAKPESVDPELSAARSRAGAKGGQARAAQRTNPSGVDAAEPDFATPGQANGVANGQANPSKPEAKVQANSTPVACGLPAFATDFAAEVARPLSPFLPSSASSQPTERQTESEEGTEREGGSARASTDAADKQTEANGLANGLAKSKQTEANGQAKSQANGQANGHANTRQTGSKVPITDDWQPTAEAVSEMQERGSDPDLVAKKYRAWCLTEDRRSADHDAGFRLFYLKEHPPHRSVAVNGVVKPDKDAWKMEEARAIYRAKFGNGKDGSPIIDVEAE